MISLRHIGDKIKAHKEEIFLVALIVLVAIFSFGLGRLSKIVETKSPIEVLDYGQN
ncbi:MAG: hypothetical protein WC797_02020 [Candidatus Paceibacterota bacterium]